jgi:hypothetical protein
VSPEEDAVRRVVALLERHAIPYMVTGSLASSYHGRPRATHDADIVIDPSAPQLAALVKDLEADGFYVDAASAHTALEQRRQFNAIDVQYACKIDLIVCKDRAFSRQELARRQRHDLAFAQAVAVVSPEDAVLSKLEWARRSGDSERQLRDAAGILELNPGLDRGYIAHWAPRLGVAELWEQLDTSR